MINCVEKYSSCIILYVHVHVHVIHVFLFPIESKSISKKNDQKSIIK